MTEVVTQWEAGLAAAARGEATAAAGWEHATEHLLKEYPTRAAMEGKDVRAKVEAVLARLFLSAEERRLVRMKGARGLSESEQKAKTKALAKVRTRWASLLDKWLFPESARVPIDGTFWCRNAVGYGVSSVERVPTQTAGGGKRRATAAAAGGAGVPNTLDAIADFGIQTPADLWAIHDRGPLADGCGGWRQFRIVFAAPSSYGKSFLAREMLQARFRQMAADPRGVGPIGQGGVVVFSGSGGAGWTDILREHVYEYDADELAAKYAEWESEAIRLKAAGKIPPPRLFILDDLASHKGVEQNETITRMYTQGRHHNISVVLIGQSPKGLVSPTRKSNSTLYFFGEYSREPQYNKPFAAAARTPEPIYADWCRSHLGKKNGFVFGCQTEEGIGMAELPWCLAAATKPEVVATDETDMASIGEDDNADYEEVTKSVAASLSKMVIGKAGPIKDVRLYDVPRAVSGVLPLIEPGVKTVGFFEAGVAITVGECLWGAAGEVVAGGLALCDDDDL